MHDIIGREFLIEKGVFFKMPGIKLTTLAYAAHSKKRIYVESMGQLATVIVRRAALDANHSYPLDYIVSLEDKRSFKVCWDKFFQAHVLDSSDHEVKFDVSEEVFDSINA